MFPNIFPIFYFDPPQVLNTYVTNIPGSGSNPLQVIANSGGKSSSAIYYIDTTGDYIGVYMGSPGNEVLRCIIGGGQTTTVPVVIPAFSRVSLRSMSASAITTGYLTALFLGAGWNGGSS